MTQVTHESFDQIDGITTPEYVKKYVILSNFYCQAVHANSL